MAIITMEQEAHNIASELIEKHVFACMEDTEELYVYEKGVFVPRGEIIIKQHVESVRADSTTHFVNEVIGHVKRRSFVSRDKFDNDPFVLNLINGFYDVRTGELIPHVDDEKPKYLSVIQYPFEFDANAVCPIIDKFVETTHPDDNERIFLYEDAADSFCRIPMKGFTMHGGANDTGKSTWIKFLRVLLGRKNCSNVKLQELIYDKFKTVELFGKAANMYADIPPDALEKVGDLKVISGEDDLKGEYKFKNPFYFENKARLKFSCNQFPEMPADDDSIYNRIRTFFWNKQFLPGDPERDEYMLQRMSETIELSGFFNKILPHIKYILEHGSYEQSQSIDQVRTDYKQFANHFDKFCTAWIVEKKDGFVPKSPLFSTAYHDFCRENKLKPLSKNAFNNRIFQRYKVIEGKKDNRIHVWFGIESTKPLESETGQSGSLDNL